MKFDNQYLVRWGIPGWTIIFGFGIYIALTFNFKESLLNGLIKDSAGLLAVMFSLIIVSVPLGYLLHQIYFYFDFYSKRKKTKVINDVLKHYQLFIKPPNWYRLTLNEKYFLLEYEWHVSLFKVEDGRRDYIAERYRYLLTTKHALGVLRFSLGIVIALVLGYQILYLQWEHLIGFILYSIFLLITFAITWLNFKYYSQNLNTIQGKFMEYLTEINNENL